MLRVCIHEIFITADIYESLDRRGILPSQKKKKNPPSDKRSSIIAISIFFSFLSFFPLLTHVAYFISFVESFGIRNWRQPFFKSRILKSILDSNFGAFVQTRDSY